MMVPTPGSLLLFHIARRNVPVSLNYSGFNSSESTLVHGVGFGLRVSVEKRQD